MSIHTGTSLQTDIPALKALWKQAFGDEDAAIDAFFSTAYTPEGVFVLKEDGRLRAMACWLPATICYNRRGWRAAYLYAVATDQAARGRGFCGKLLAFAQGFLEPRGVKALLLVPGEPSLRQFYQRHGYGDFSAVDLLEAPAAAAAGEAQWVEAPVYLELREQFLQDRAYVSSPVPVLEFQNALARVYGGGLLRLVQGDTEGCACAALDGQGRAVIYELLWPGDWLQGASLAASAMGAKDMLVRTPGSGTAFAMAKWLTEPPTLPEPYLGLALD